MKIKINPHTLAGSVTAVASKSHAHRLLIAAALSENDADVTIHTLSEDIQATRSCLRKLQEPVPMLDCHESGSTLRFLIPTVMALKEEAVFFGSGRLPKRPISPLKEEMEAHGCKFENHGRQNGNAREICCIKGRLRGGTFTLPGNVSSQYITGLLFALPLLSEDSRICITSPLESKGYVDLTLDVLKQFGIQIRTEEENGLLTYIIKGQQSYQAPPAVCAEGDWSNSAFWAAGGILSSGSGILCTGIDPASIQGDREILNLARKMGGKITEKPNGFLAAGAPLCGISIDASGIPDLVPVLSVLAAVSQGTTHIYNAHRLRIKESDRLSAMHDCLTKLGASVVQEKGGLVIHGVPRLKGGTVSGYNDHRIVMSMAIASIVSDSPIIIEGADAVNKSYPGFFEDFRSLGGEYHVL